MPTPGRVVEVTFTRELANGELLTQEISSTRLPASIFVTSSAIAAHLRVEAWRQRQWLYHRPVKHWKR
jgi:hypothetical protein